MRRDLAELNPLNSFQGKCQNLSNFQILETLRKLIETKKLSDDEHIDRLKHIRDLNLAPEQIWNERGVRLAMSNFYNHHSLRDENNDPIESLSPESEFTEYLVNRIATADQTTFKTTLYSVFSLLCLASVTTEERKKSFFQSFPPQGDELQCLGGTGTRIEEFRRILEAGHEDQYFIERLTSTLHELIAKTNIFVDPGNQVHTKPYLEYMISLVTKEELQKTDGDTFSVALDIPFNVIADIYERFPIIFKDRLIKSLSDEVLRQEAYANAAIAISEAIDKAIRIANDKGKDSRADPAVKNTYKDADPITRELFESEISQSDFESFGEGNPRVLLAIMKLFEECKINTSEILSYFTVGHSESEEASSY